MIYLKDMKMQNLKKSFQNNIKEEIQNTEIEIRRLEENFKAIPQIISDHQKHIEDLKELLESVKTCPASFDVKFSYEDEDGWN